MLGLGKLLLMLWMLCVLISGCSHQTVAPTEATNDATSVVRLAAYRHEAPGETDAFYCNRALAVWEPLVTNDAKGWPAPCLATHWTMLENGRKWRFYLRQTARFHDGTPFNADAVLKNFTRMGQGVKPSAFYPLRRENFYPHFTGIVKVNDYTVELSFAKPVVNLPFLMMNYGSAMFAPSCFKADGNFSGMVIGTGPFRMVRNELGKVVELARNDNYDGEKAKSAQVIIYALPSEEARYSALKTGEIDGVFDFHALPPSLAAELLKDPRFAISTSPSQMVQMLLLHDASPPLNDVRLRRAISLIIDRALLTQTLYLGYAKPTVNLLSESSPYWKDFPVSFDREEAKRLAHEVLGDKRMRVRYLVNGADPVAKGEAELIAFWLADIGLDVEIYPLEYAMLTAELRHGRYEIARSQQGLPNGDPTFIFRSFLMQDGARNHTAALGYDSSRARSLLYQLEDVTDENVRREIFDQLQATAIEELLVVPLYYDDNLVAYCKDLQGFTALPYGASLTTMWKTTKGE